jgi:hypothetical protein
MGASPWGFINLTFVVSWDNLPKKEFESEGNLMRETGRRSWIERRQGKDLT